MNFKVGDRVRLIGGSTIRVIVSLYTTDSGLPCACTIPEIAWISQYDGPVRPLLLSGIEPVDTTTPESYLELFV